MKWLKQLILLSFGLHYLNSFKAEFIYALKCLFYLTDLSSPLIIKVLKVL